MLLINVPIEKGSYIAGFVDGEGSFYISVRRRKDYRSGWKFSLHFNISNGDKAVLGICKEYLGCGEVRQTTNRNRPHFLFEVADRAILRKNIIPFFTKFGFLSNKKKAEFRIFNQALHFMEVEEIKDYETLEKILMYRKQLGEYRTERTQYTDEAIRATFRELRIDRIEA
jgi:hypothetical protein